MSEAVKLSLLSPVKLDMAAGHSSPLDLRSLAARATAGAELLLTSAVPSYPLVTTSIAIMFKQCKLSDCIY